MFLRLPFFSSGVPRSWIGDSVLVCGGGVVPYLFQRKKEKSAIDVIFISVVALYSYVPARESVLVLVLN